MNKSYMLPDTENALFTKPNHCENKNNETKFPLKK